MSAAIAVFVASVCGLGVAVIGALFGLHALDEKRARLVIEKLHEQEMARLQGRQLEVDARARALSRELEALARTTTPSTKACHDGRCGGVGKHHCHNLDCKEHKP